VFYFCQFLGADVSAHRAFLTCLVQCHLMSIFCTFVIEQINDDKKMMTMTMRTTASPMKCHPVKWHPVVCRSG